MKKLFLSLLFLLTVIVIKAARVDTVFVHSASMNKNVKTLVIVPEARDVDMPVIYLLHGYGGNANVWIGIKPNLPKIADETGIMFVCPDGKNSWYWDSPLNSGYRYETFVSKELTCYVDTNYSTIKDRSGRAITGLSMGGHGAMWLALRNKDVFGAVGSTSGGLDIRPFPKNWEMSEQLGMFDENKELWDSHTVINQLHNIEDGDLSIIFDCGYDDFFYEVNKAFHEELLQKKIDHDYTVRPGGHNGSYWNNSIDFQILFFKKFFNK